MEAASRAGRQPALLLSHVSYCKRKVRSRRLGLHGCIVNQRQPGVKVLAVLMKREATLQSRLRFPEDVVH